MVKIHKPKIVPEFYAGETGCEVRIQYEVVGLDGVPCVCNSADDALDLLQHMAGIYANMIASGFRDGA